MRKILVSLLAILPFWWTVTSCNNAESASSVPGPRNKIVIILCDLTTSTDSAATRKNTLDDISTLLRRLPARVHYYVYPIGENIRPAIFQGFTGEDAEGVYDKNVRKYMECRNKVKEAFAPVSSNRTCIIDELEGIASQIAYLKKEMSVDTIQLYIISDMLEVCTVNGTWVNFENPKFDTGRAQQSPAGLAHKPSVSDPAEFDAVNCAIQFQ